MTRIECLIENLYKLSDWADDNKYDVPSHTADIIFEAAHELEQHEGGRIIWEYPVIEPDATKAISYCSKCGAVIDYISKIRYCPLCGAHFTKGVESADCWNCIHYVEDENACANLDAEGNCLGWQYDIMKYGMEL